MKLRERGIAAGNFLGVMTMIALFGALVAVLAGCSNPQGKTFADKRDAIQEMETKTLDRLYTQMPETREEIKDAAGYAVFSTVGTSYLVVTGSDGYGIAHNNETGKNTYMRMGSFGVGPGVGQSKFQLVMIFDDAGTMGQFIRSGWTWGARGSSDWKTVDESTGETKGGATSGEALVMKGTKIYQLTDTGIALTGSVAGTKFSYDQDLNNYPTRNQTMNAAPEKSDRK
ncbi:hypothetical protein [Poriferisphaera sp. WC338]|uniref:lipid-binding SYLF domain-containing protein n=1 Tax=Poriferisphaera sp. WC338 TaxID=3425129 RepID=UPI003D81AC8E